MHWIQRQKCTQIVLFFPAAIVLSTCESGNDITQDSTFSFLTVGYGGGENDTFYEVFHSIWGLGSNKRYILKHHKGARETRAKKTTPSRER